MSPTGRRRRAAVLLCLALACGSLAASDVRARLDRAEERVGPAVPVLVAGEDLPAGARLEEAAGALSVRSVPARYVPADALADPAEAAGLRLAAPLRRGAYVTTGVVEPGEEDPALGSPLRPGERALEVSVAGLGGAAGATPGARVDVIVTTEPRAGGAGRTYVALEDVELLELRAGGSEGEDGAAADPPGAGGAGAGGPAATLRLTSRQAVFLTAAQAFAREIRLVVRPPRDRRRTGPLVVEGGEL